MIIEENKNKYYNKNINNNQDRIVVDNIEEDFDAEINPDADRVAFGLRDTGYDFNTAIADIIDNSITADATKVDVSLNVSPSGDISVYICDNGCGMCQQELRNAMKYGSKERSEKNSLSKFGLGLKTASTAFCRCLSLISRGNDGITRKIQWDLDYIAQINKWKPKTMPPSNCEKNILDSVAGEGTGTLVVWEKVDRLLSKSISDYTSRTKINSAIKNKKEKLRQHLGLTFQRFIDVSFTECKNIEISIDMNKVDAVDPFCREEPETAKYPLKQQLKIKVDEGEEHSVGLVAYVLPRQTDFSTPDARNIANISVSTEGFYVYRENRLIHYGDWLGMFSNEPHYSLLRVEFSFGAELDSAFNVDIKKSRILPADEIISWIKNNFIAPPRKEANDRYRIGKIKQIEEKTKEFSAHDSSNRNIENKASKTEESKMTQSGENTAIIENKNGSFNHRIEIVSDVKNGEMRIIPVEDLEHGNLWKPCLTAGSNKHSVKINQSHIFYRKIYYPIIRQKVMVSGIDALLWALAEAENSVVNQETEDYYEDMRISVSRQLKKLLADFPEPEPDTDIFEE